MIDSIKRVAMVHSLLRDGSWSLLFNVMNKVQTLCVLLSGALIGGVVGAGRLSALAAAPTLAASFADFGYSYERSRHVAANMSSEAGRTAVGGIPGRALLGGILAIGAFFLSIGHKMTIPSPALFYSALFLLGVATTSSLIASQLLNALRRFRAVALMLGGLRIASALTAVSFAVAGRNLNAIVASLALGESLAAGVLITIFVHFSRHLKFVETGVASDRYTWLGVSNSINTVLNRCDLLLVGAIAGPFVLGIYSVASQLENAVESFALSPSIPLIVHVARARATRVSLHPLIRQSLKATLAVGIAGSFAVIVAYIIYATLPVSSESLRLGSAGYCICLTVASGTVIGAAGVYVSAMIGSAQYRTLALVRIANAVIAVLCFVLLTKGFGVGGAATSAAIRDVTLLAIVYAVWHTISQTGTDLFRSSTDRNSWEILGDLPTSGSTVVESSS